MRRVLFVLCGVVALAFPALGATESQATGVHHAGALGLVAPQIGGRIVGHFRSPRPGFGGSSAAAPPGPANVDNLTYNGPDQPGNGPVMRTNTAYTIFWVPSGYSIPSNYQSTVDRYFGDVAAASGANSNVYSASVQYSDTTGPIAYNSTFSGSAVDTNVFPASDCTVPSDVIGTTECLGDDQLRAEVKRFADSQGWPHGPNVEFFLYTPNDVGSCFYSDANAPLAGNTCAYDTYCAYHSEFDSGTTASEYIYADMAWPNQELEFDGSFYSSDCNTGEHPNGSGQDATDVNAADEVISVTSHEHNESITDPRGTAWWDDNRSSLYGGSEDGDLCAWSWFNGGPTGLIGGSMSDGSAYNQSINGHHYFTQGEWSNQSATSSGWSGCVWTLATVPVNTGPPTISGTATVGQTLTGSAGLWSGSPSSYAFAWLRCDAGGNNCTTTKTATSSTPSSIYLLAAADENHTIKLSVVATSSVGSSPAALSNPTATVTAGEPLNTGAPSLSGTTTVGQTLTGNVGAWSPAATIYQSKLLRCNNAAANCTVIRTFTGTTISYILAAADDRQTLELSVVASNAAGSSAPATSNPTAIVNGEPENTGAAPSLTGTATVAQTLTGNAGSWSFSPASYTFAWLRCDSSGDNCATIKTLKAATTSQTYRLATADDKHTIKLSVTATNKAGTGSPAISNTTPVVNGEPVNSAVPVISGTPATGHTLTGTSGTWTPSATSYTYTWLRCDSGGNTCTTIKTVTSAAASQTYTPSTADKAHTIRLSVMAKNLAGTSATAISNATAVIP